MKSIYAILIFFGLFFINSCIEPNKPIGGNSVKTNNTPKVNIDINLEIVKGGKVHIENNAKLDSFNGFLLKTSIKNLSTDTFKFFMVVSIYPIIQKFEPRLKGLDFFCCDNTYWELFYLLKNQKMEIYNCMLDPTLLWYFQNNGKLRVGFIYITEEDERLAYKNDLWKILQNKTANRSDIFWSNYVDFKEYIPSLKTNIFKGNIIIKDSLEKVLSIHSGYIH